MSDWKELSIEARACIEDSLMRELARLGIKGSITRWSKPSKKIPHWQFNIQSSWCAGKAARIIEIALKHAMGCASIDAPKEAITLGGPPA
jgi:hypothetical protein